jgi:2-haloacid dehalogenase
LKQALQEVKALVFDVFGTVVDWRASVIREGERNGRKKRLEIDWGAFADAWRAGYPAAMDLVRTGALPWHNVDRLHRRILDELLAQFGVDAAFDETEREDFNRVWHRLKPWPDVVAGLRRLKRAYVIGTLSNGNVSLLVDMAKHAKLPWDVVFSAELFRHYKPDPQAYLGAVELLGLRPYEVMLVAAHKTDLDGAKRCGLRTGFVARPLEYGPRRRQDVTHEIRFDLNVRDFHQLARRLDC